jgi:hypothetical protein
MIVTSIADRIRRARHLGHHTNIIWAVMVRLIVSRRERESFATAQPGMD